MHFKPGDLGSIQECTPRPIPNTPTTLADNPLPFPRYLPQFSEIRVQGHRR